MILTFFMFCTPWSYLILLLCQLTGTSSQLVIAGLGSIIGHRYFVELYAQNHIQHLSEYGLAVSHKSGGSAAQEFTFPDADIPAESFIYVSDRDQLFLESYFETDLDYFYQYMSLNLKFGDDVVELFNGSVMIDVYGYIEFKGKDFDWEYYKGWGRRANLSMPPTDVFNISDWIVSGTGALNNPNSNANSTWPYGMTEEAVTSLGATDKTTEDMVTSFAATQKQTQEAMSTLITSDKHTQQTTETDTTVVLLNDQTSSSIEYTNDETSPGVEYTNDQTFPSVKYLNNKTSPGVEYTNTQTSPSVEYTNEQTSPGAEYTNDQTFPSVEHTNEQTSSSVEYTNDQTSPSVEYTNDQTSPSVQHTNDQTSPSVEYTREQTSSQVYLTTAKGLKAGSLRTQIFKSSFGITRVSHISKPVEAPGAPAIGTSLLILVLLWISIIIILDFDTIAKSGRICCKNIAARN